jgi:hypothetical protein
MARFCHNFLRNCVKGRTAFLLYFLRFQTFEGSDFRDGEQFCLSTWNGVNKYITKHNYEHDAGSALDDEKGF